MNGAGIHHELFSFSARLPFGANEDVYVLQYICSFRGALVIVDAGRISKSSGYLELLEPCAVPLTGLRSPLRRGMW